MNQSVSNHNTHIRPATKVIVNTRKEPRIEFLERTVAAPVVTMDGLAPVAPGAPRVDAGVEFELECAYVVGLYVCDACAGLLMG